MRIARVEGLLRAEIAKILHEKVGDSRIGFITITAVSVSKDLSYAKILYSQLGSDAQKAKTKTALQSAARFIKGEIGKTIRLRTIPNLHFVYDDSIERASTIYHHLSKLNDKTT